MMIEHLKRRFEVTDEGAEGLIKAMSFSFILYIVNMLPVIMIMILSDQLLLGNIHNRWLYFGVAVITLIFLYIILNLEYEKLFNETYKESANLRVSIAKTLANLPLEYFSKHNLSDLAQSVMSDVEAIEHAMSHAIPKIYALYLFIPIMGIMLIIGNIKMGLAVIIPVIIRFLILRIYKKKVFKGNDKYHKVLRDNSERFQEFIEMHQEIKSFNLTEKFKNELYNQMDYSEKVHLKAENSAVMIMAISSLFSFLSLALVLIVGIRLMISGSMNILYLIGYLISAMKIKDLVDISSEFILEIYYIMPRVDKIKEIKNTTLQKGLDKEINKYDIELKHVDFSYEDDRKVLSDVSFTVREGESTALVGASGSGKTTILKLVSRLYDYDDGKIIIDGHDIKDISTSSLFEKISIVFQDVTLFNTSIMENIRIGRLDASDDEVKNAAKLANCMEFIEKMPNGFDTQIGENGAALSGGERQRLSIARAFLKDAPILILDEISSNLDIENERKIQESLNKLTQNKTVIVISHRLKSIENVDKIIVFDEGKKESEGRHNELISQSEVYKNLVEKAQIAEEFKY